MAHIYIKTAARSLLSSCVASAAGRLRPNEESEKCLAVGMAIAAVNFPAWLFPPEPDRRYLFRFSFTRNFTIFVTNVSGSGLFFGNCTAPLDDLNASNCF